MATVRSAKPDDLASIVEIHNELLDTTTYEWTEVAHTLSEWRVRLEDKAARAEPLLVSEEDGEVCGWATYGDFRDTSRWPGYALTVEHTIHFAERWWRRGLGRQLLSALMDEARRANKTVMVAGIDSTNEASIAFHAHCGFVDVARMPDIGQKWGRALTLVLMQRRVDDRASDAP
ncbi:MAG: GNAT family N-acetyltransferase [Acidimicrobiales bacterium]